MKFIIRSLSISFLALLMTINISEARGKGGYSGYKSSGGYKMKTYSPKSYKLPSSTSKSYSPKISSPKLNSSSTGTKVNGYYRKDGTYVRPHYRSNPDSDKSNNFGKPSSEQRQQYKSSSTLPTFKYDYDKDGLSNARDKDDDNDFVLDNNDKAPYNPNKQ